MLIFASIISLVSNCVTFGFDSAAAEHITTLNAWRRSKSLELKIILTN